jgi:hypothetical protein
MKKNKIAQKLSGSFSKLVPKMNASGLWIVDGLVSHYNPNDNKDEQTSLRLPPGVVSGGRVQNPLGASQANIAQIAERSKCNFNYSYRQRICPAVYSAGHNFR